MQEALASAAADWAEADPATEVLPALHLIATCASRVPGADRRYRTRATAATIEQVAGWAEARGWLLFLDLQVGHSSIRDELPRLLPWLARPYVHLALDPEFAMKDGSPPGTAIGTLDATDVNGAIAILARIVDSLRLPPKVLVVHRFTGAMVTGVSRIHADPRVQVVIDMDGFGTPNLKRSTYAVVIPRRSPPYPGFKLFTSPRLDRPMMGPAEVLRLKPAPLFILYQ